MTATRPPKPLTLRQKDILRAFVAYQSAHQCPPTLRELSRAVGLHTRHGVQTSLDALVCKGWLTCLPRTSRGYRLPAWLADKTPAEVLLLIDSAPTAERKARCEP